MKIKGVVFDLDHTLYDRYKTLDIVMPIIYEKFKKFISDELSKQAFTEITKTADAKRIHYGWDAVFEYLEQRNIFKVGTDFSKEMYLRSIFENFKIYAEKYNFSKPLLDDLKGMGLKTGLITNGSGELQRRKLELLGLENSFDEIVISKEVGFEKPDARIFELAANRLLEKPENLLYVGDHPINDAKGSKDAGYIPVLVMTMGFETMPVASEFDNRIPSVKYLKELIENKFM